MASALEDLFAGQPMKETEGADVSSSPLNLGRSQAGRGLWLGAARACAGAHVPHRGSSRPMCSPLAGRSPAGVDYYDAAVVQFANGATAALSGAATVPKHRGFQIDLQAFRLGGHAHARHRARAARSAPPRRTRQRSSKCRRAPALYECEKPLSTLVISVLAVRSRTNCRLSPCAPSKFWMPYRSAAFQASLKPVSAQIHKRSATETA